MVDPVQFEINLPNHNNQIATEMASLANFMAKYRCPAVVAAPAYVESAMIERLRTNGRWKVIAAIDFEGQGRDFGMRKFTQQLPRSVLQADGFDILLSGGRSNADHQNELTALTGFVRQLSQVHEIRWTLGTRFRTPEQLAVPMAHFSRWPGQFIRTSTDVMGEPVSEELHRKDIELIRKFTSAPIKLSGVGDAQVMSNLRTKVARFDVTLTQAQRLMRQWEEIQRRVGEEKNDLASAKDSTVRT